jgi:hypothetical protein
VTLHAKQHGRQCNTALVTASECLGGEGSVCWEMLLSQGTDMMNKATDDYAVHQTSDLPCRQQTVWHAQ